MLQKLEPQNIYNLKKLIDYEKNEYADFKWVHVGYSTGFCATIQNKVSMTSRKSHF